jgi:hypothetical protein
LGTSNVAVGTSALQFNTTGNVNTAVGYAALFTNTTGTNNTGIGYFADVATNNLFNATAVGANAIVNASNKIRLGSTGTVVSASSYITESDGRLKENISDADVPGLSFIAALQPVAYNFNYTAFNNFLRSNSKNERIHDNLFITYQQHLVKLSQKREIGFVAQDVEKLIREKGYSFNGVYAPQNDNDNYGLDYSKFVVPLVKAVQEQQSIIEEQQKLIDELLKRVEALEKK